MSGLDETSVLLLVIIAVVALSAIPLLPRIPDVHPIFLRSQAEASKVRHEGESAVYHSSQVGMRSKLFSSDGKELLTLVDVWDEAVRLGARYSDYHKQSVSLAVWDTQAKSFGRGLLALGLKPGDVVAIVSSASIFWLAAEIGASSAGLAVIGIDGLSAELPEALAKAKQVLKADIFLVDPPLLDLDQIERLLHGSRMVCLSESLPDNSSALSWTDVVSKGVSANATPDIQRTATVNYQQLMVADATMYLVYSHSNRLASIAAFASSFGHSKKLSSKDRSLATLPYWDVCTRTCVYAALLEGGHICIGSGSPATLPSDCRRFMPTTLQTSSTAAASIVDATRMMPKSTFFDFAVRRKLNILMSGCALKDSFWDRVFLREVQTLTGRELRMIHILEGTVDRDTVKYLAAVFGTQIVSTLTRPEAGGLVTASHPADYLGFDEYSETDTHLGSPVTDLEMKVKNVVKDGSHTLEGIEDGADPVGEILIKGPMVVRQYIADSGAVGSTLADGWYSSGAIGQIQVNGTLKLVDI